MLPRLPQAARASLPTCHDPPIATLRPPRRSDRRACAAAAIALALATAGCGGDDGRGLGRAHLPVLSERDPAGDVADSRALTRAMAKPNEIAEHELAEALVDTRPELDLRGAGASIKDRTLRLRILTEGPTGPGTFLFWALTKDCRDLHVMAEVDDDGTATVGAGDLLFERGRPIDGAEAEVDGQTLTVTVPLRADAELEEWTVNSASPGADRPDADGYGDSVPDWYIEGAYFTRGTGTPNYVEPAPCGPPGPPLLAR